MDHVQCGGISPAACPEPAEGLEMTWKQNLFSMQSDSPVGNDNENENLP
jgi:hypothetical protein